MTSEGVEVHVGRSVADARGLTGGGFACALLDLDLGDGDGTDVATVLRQRQPGLPIAFFSGGAPEAVAAAARRIGPMFQKPDDLEAAIAWVLGCTRP